MKRAQAAVAAVALATVMACLYVIVEAGRQIYRTIGPSKAVATRDGGLMLVSHGALHVFGADGRRMGSHSLEQLGASLTPSDMAVHRDGRVVLADPDGSRLLRCTLPAGPCEALHPALKRVGGQAALPLNSVKVWIDDERGRYYLSDNAGHRIVIADLGGKTLAASGPNLVWFPNQLQLRAPGELAVVDTNHQRVATFDVSGDKVGRLLHELPTRSGVARHDRVWPFDAVRTPDGATWVLVAREGMKDADLVVFDAAGRASRRVELGEDADPFDIELWRDRVIVADATRYRVDAVSLDGSVAPAFADDAFERELAHARREPDRWRDLRLVAQVGIVLVPLLAIVFLRKLGVVPVLQTRPEATSAAPAALTSEPQWLEVDAGIAQRAHKAMIPFMLAIAALAGGFAFLYRETLAENPAMAAQLGVGLVIVILATLHRPRAGSKPPTRFRGLRLGASLRGVHYEMSRGQAFLAMKRAQGVAPWKDVYFDGRQLLAGGTVIPVKQPIFGYVFYPARFASLVAAHIPQRNLLTPAQLGRRMIGASGPLVWIVFVLLVVAMAAWAILRTSL